MNNRLGYIAKTALITLVLIVLTFFVMILLNLYSAEELQESMTGMVALFVGIVVAATAVAYLVPLSRDKQK